ncbi:MAG: sigma-54 dependent transcriptional regulator [bacterium]|nr:sigma-54 dependent transcriptional regulator [bacterium]
MVIQHRHKFDELTGKSPQMKLVFQRIQEIAPNDVTVLITGESGTGKELVAQSIHNRSNRAAGPFIPVNTGAISRDLVGSELFGHQQGAFTGATETKLGKFEQARGGTLFLDEISSMDEATQISLLRVLETKKFQRIGGRRFINADVRIIAASNENLLNEFQRNIRQDLFHRLSVFTINIPPLRERDSDIEILAEELLDNAGEEFNKTINGFDRQASFALNRYNWPGNVREMKNVIQRAVLICPGKKIRLEHLPDRIRNASHSQQEIILPVGVTLKQAEQIIIRNTIHSAGGNRKKAAEILGISRRALYNKLKKHNSKKSE